MTRSPRRNPPPRRLEQNQKPPPPPEPEADRPSRQQRCSECGDAVASQPNLYTGDMGRIRLCLDCATKLQAKAGMEANINDFVLWYLTEHSHLTRAELLDRIAQLEAELAAARQHKP